MKTALQDLVNKTPSPGCLDGLPVVYVVSGYPSSARPQAGVFVHRSIQVLSRQIEPLVIHLRAMRPGRPVVKHRFWEDIKVIELSVPVIPGYGFNRLKAWLISLFGLRLVKPIIQKARLVHSTKITPIGFAVDRWAKAADRPHVAQAIGRDVNLNLLYAQPDTMKWLYGIDGIVCNTVPLRNRLLELAPGLKTIKVIHRGVDTCVFGPDGITQGPQKDLPKVRFLYLGGFQTWDPDLYDTVNYKGGHILLEAWQQAEASLGTSSLLIGGSGVEYARLEKWISGLSKPEKVKLVSLIKPDTVPAYLRACDVVVLPSVTDGLPNLANEAQACERPVLGTDAGGIPETVKHGETGIIVRRNSARELAEGFRWFYQNQRQIQMMGKKARKNMIDNFDWSVFRRKVLELYKCTLDNYTKVQNR